MEINSKEIEKINTDFNLINKEIDLLKKKFHRSLILYFIIWIALIIISVNIAFFSEHRKYGFTFPIVLYGGFIFFPFIIYIRDREIKRKNDKLSVLLYLDFKKSLEGTDKKDALEKGRKYYSFIRGGHLSIYDEAALKNDLDSMRF